MRIVFSFGCFNNKKVAKVDRASAGKMNGLPFIDCFKSLNRSFARSPV